MLEKSNSLYYVEMITVFQRRMKVSLSMLNQSRNLKLENVDFGLTIKTFLFFCSVQILMGE